MTARLASAVLLAALLVSACGGAAPKSTNGTVPGLSAPTASILNGVWDQTEIRQSATAFEGDRLIGTYSWGKGKYIANMSFVVDLGAAVPYISIPVIGDFAVVKATEVSGGEVDVSLRNTKADGTPQIGDLRISMLPEGTISVKGNLDMGTFGEFKYYRTYGPAAP